MDLLGTIMKQLDGKALSDLASGIGVNEGQAKNAVMAALPMLLSGLQRNASNPEGAQALDRALERDHDGGILGQLGGLLGSGGSSEGQKILGHIFGGRTQRVEQGVSSVAGIDMASAGKLLSTLAPMVMGSLGQTKRETGLGANDLGALLQREERAVRETQPEASGLVNMLLDADGDGDVDFSDSASRGAGLLGGLFKR